MKPFIDFYEKLGFVPTGTLESQKLENLNTLKDLLYFHLGITRSLVMKSDILEIGAGSGENLVRLIKQNPKSISILDGSKTVINKLKDKIDFMGVKHKFILSDAENYSSRKKYDIVIVEGTVCFQLRPIQMFRNISDLVSENGMLIVTTTDEFSIFSEIVRRYLVKKIFHDLSLNDKNINQVSEFFSKDFTYLPGMTRDVKHWTLDSIFNPWGGDLFTLKNALEAVDKDFKMFSVHPRIIQDWRWYKDPSYFLDIKNNNSEIDSYMKNCINFIDQRFVVDGIDLKVYFSMSRVLKDFYYGVRDFILRDVDYSNEDFQKFLKDLLSFSQYLHVETIRSIESLYDWTVNKKNEDLDDFRKLWGRGQQFVSLIRKD
jgi:2-polyprenyl-3-methyl-5-hydroxy-6-metoxy-1,4-benzoquinol methylase